MEAPVPGVEYPIHLGSSFLDVTASEAYCTLRYDFKPASVLRDGRGELLLQSDSQKVRDLDCGPARDQI